MIISIDAEKVSTKFNIHPDIKTRQRHYKKRKLQTNITDEYRCKDPQQNTS